MNIGNINFFKKNHEGKNKNSVNSTEVQADSQTKDVDLTQTPPGYYSQMEIQGVKPIDTQAYPKHMLKNYTGCLIGGSIGDALGWPIEFRRLNEIKRIYGDKGITDLEKINGIAEITDDTQMTIFTADGLLKSAIKNFDENSLPNIQTVYKSYKNWLGTQYNGYSKNDNGWISNIKGLYVNRAPGTTCITSLERGIPGSIETPINNSKGCGGVMRVAPAGLMYYKNPKLAFEVGARCAALTHSNPGAYLPAGVHSCIIANLIQGKSLEKAVDNSIEILKEYKGCEDTLYLLEMAKDFAHSDIDSVEAIRNLGEGWTGDEAIAISVYCALKSSDNFEKALLMSVNHDGDSDSTGAIVGNILGTYLGEDGIPDKWKNSVELSSELRQIALDLYSKPAEIGNAKARYTIY